MAKRKKRFEVRAWIGVIDGDIYWADDATGRHDASLADLFRTRKAGLDLYDDVRRVTIIVPRGLEGPHD